jgi:hypothetical protein
MRFVDIASSNRMATDSTNRLERSLALFYVVRRLPGIIHYRRKNG